MEFLVLLIGLPLAHTCMQPDLSSHKTITVHAFYPENKLFKDDKSSYTEQNLKQKERLGRFENYNINHKLR